MKRYYTYIFCVLFLLTSCTVPTIGPQYDTQKSSTENEIVGNHNTVINNVHGDVILPEEKKISGKSWILPAVGILLAVFAISSSGGSDNNDSGSITNVDVGGGN